MLLGYTKNMKFVDEITLTAIAGDGGNGVVRWNQNRNNPKGGPAGGNGGRGGDVVLRAVRDISLLSRYRGNTVFRAGNGGSGGKSSLYGATGEDVVIDLPVGSIVRVAELDKVYELLEEGEEVVVLKGGRGGLGNEHFKSSRNVRPTEMTGGKSGQKSELEIELKLIADIGLVGFPNAGKTSLLNALTNAQAKVGSYAFTTLDPNLGEFHKYIIADIPGIIEGASKGKGLGYQFLRHISRTKTLIFCISVELDDPVVAYEALLGELRTYDKKMVDAPFLIALTKTDLRTPEEVERSAKVAQKVTPNVLVVSSKDEESRKQFGDDLIRFVRSLE